MQLLSAYTDVTKEEMNTVTGETHLWVPSRHSYSAALNGIARGYSESYNHSMKPELQK